MRSSSGNDERWRQGWHSWWLCGLGNSGRLTRRSPVNDEEGGPRDSKGRGFNFHRRSTHGGYVARTTMAEKQSPKRKPHMQLWEPPMLRCSKTKENSDRRFWSCIYYDMEMEKQHYIKLKLQG
ncbi:hypothetical protein PIB30_089708 [Stylosanthes scabra]|uniref:Uncharacterized protein n=1 Tax=Stylosanthes scabra TaxID=79078 RepID=A0ABU6VU87_9FABA|nr:hypothetical protein [Stylosanthes scabra]